MKPSLVIAAVSLLAVACSDDASPANPTRLWLAPDGSELQVKLVSAEPTPY